MNIKVTELGCVGHFRLSHLCRWRRHTQIIGPSGRFRVSSLGNFYPTDNLERQPFISDCYFETMVFNLSDLLELESEMCGCIKVISWKEIDRGLYRTIGEAQEGHQELVKKYTTLANRIRIEI